MSKKNKGNKESVQSSVNSTNSNNRQTADNLNGGILTEQPYMNEKKSKKS